MAVSATGAQAWVIRPGCLFDDRDGFIDGVDLLVDGSTIARIAPRGSLPSSLPVHHAEDATLIPGLFDSHVHLTFSADAQVVPNLINDSHDRQVRRAVDNAQEALRHGVTSLADCGASTEVILQARERLQDQHPCAPRLLVSGAPITAVNGHCHWLGGTVSDFEQALEAMDHLLDSGVDFIKLMLTGGNLTSGSDPRTHQFDDSFMEQVALACRARGVPLVVHVHTEAAVRRAGEVGATIAAHGTCMQPDGRIHLGPGTIAALLAGGTAVDATITVGARTDFPGATANSLTRHGQRRDMLPAFAQMSQAGIAILAGTDAGVPGVPHGVVADAITALVAEVGLPIDAALRAGTCLPAQAFGLGSTTGSLRAGLQADLLLLDGDLRRDLGALQRPRQVWRAGMLVAREGHLVDQVPPAGE